MILRKLVVTRGYRYSVDREVVHDRNTLVNEKEREISKEKSNVNLLFSNRHSEVIMPEY